MTSLSLSSIFVAQVVQQQTEAIARLGNVLKRDIRDMEIIMAEDTELTDWADIAYTADTFAFIYDDIFNVLKKLLRLR